MSETTATFTKSRVTMMILSGLFAALTAVGAWISIPLPFTPVPIILATMITSLAGGLLGPKYGSIAMIVYLLLGAVGAPVFHNFTGGLGVLVGPTGGYLIGYITSALLTGLIINAFAKKKLAWWATAIAVVVGLASCYILGTAWFMFSTGSTLTVSLGLCVFPFLPGDALKSIAAFLLIQKIRPLMKKIH